MVMNARKQEINQVYQVGLRATLAAYPDQIKRPFSIRWMKSISRLSDSEIWFTSSVSKFFFWIVETEKKAISIIPVRISTSILILGQYMICCSEQIIRISTTQHETNFFVMIVCMIWFTVMVAFILSSTNLSSIYFEMIFLMDKLQRRIWIIGYEWSDMNWWTYEFMGEKSLLSIIEKKNEYRSEWKRGKAHVRVYHHIESGLETTQKLTFNPSFRSIAYYDQQCWRTSKHWSRVQTGNRK